MYFIAVLSFQTSNYNLIHLLDQERTVLPATNFLNKPVVEKEHNFSLLEEHNIFVFH